MKIEEICCVIVSYNIGKDLYKCFHSIEKQVDKVIIVDNGSEKETIEVLKEIEEKNEAIIIYNTENKGIATALNQGIVWGAKNNYKWILTMDNDSEATNDMVKVMMETYNSINSDEKDKIVSIFPKYLEKAYDKCCNINSDINNKEFNFVEAEITSGNLIKIDILKQIGLLKESFFIDMVDVELCLRLLKNNYKMIKVDGAVLLHSLGRSCKIKILNKEVIVTNHSALRRYYITRNRFEIWNMYNDLQCAYIKNSKKDFIKETITIILFEKDKVNKIKSIAKGIRDYKKGIFGKKVL